MTDASRKAQETCAGLGRFCPDGLCPGWREVFSRFEACGDGRALREFLRGRIESGAVIYPPDPYRALRGLAPEDVSVVILGQDPNHGPGQATGMAFSVARDIRRLPPSLKNIFAEIAREDGLPVRTQGDLSDWARQGVLLLNAALSVEQGAPLSHAGRGWETLTDALIVRVLQAARPVVFMLWGAWAQKKESLVLAHAQAPVLVLKANHPSPLSARRPPAPFIGCGHFSQASAWLAAHGRRAVRWRSDDDACARTPDLFD